MTLLYPWCTWNFPKDLQQLFIRTTLGGLFDTSMSMMETEVSKRPPRVVYQELLRRLFTRTGISFWWHTIGSCTVSVVWNKVVGNMVRNKLHVNKFKQLVDVVIFSVQVQDAKVGIYERTGPDESPFKREVLRNVINHDHSDSCNIFSGNERSVEEPENKKLPKMQNTSWICVSTETVPQYITIRNRDAVRYRSEGCVA